MKKRFFSPLLILIAAFCLFSCSNQLKTKTSISMNFPINEIQKSLSARGIWDEEVSEYLASVELEVKLFVNDKVFDEPRIIPIEEKLFTVPEPVIFKNIVLGSTVYAEARVNITEKYEEKSYSYTIMYGKSETTVLDSDTKTLSIQMDYYDDEGKFVPPVFIDSIKYEFYTQKDGTTDVDNVENYELANTISLEVNPMDASKYYEYLKSYEVFMQIMDVQFDMEVGGFEEYDALSNAEPEIVDKTVYVKSYWTKTGTGITPQIFDSDTAGQDDSYKLYFYDDRYVIRNAADKKLAYGTFYTVRDADGSYKFIFCQEKAYKDGVPVMLYSMHETPDNFETCNYNATNGTIILNCIDSSRNTTPITFIIPISTDLSAYEYSTLSGNIVYAGLPNVVITKNDSTETPTICTGSITFSATLQNQEENPPLDMTAELYYQGNKVNASAYKVEFNSSTKTLSVSPISLSSGGTYVVKVIAASESSGTAYTVSNSFMVQIEGSVHQTMNVSDEYFINDLMEFIPKVNGSLELTLTGEKNFASGEKYTIENNLYANMALPLSMASQPVTLDMTNVTGTYAQVLDTSVIDNTIAESIKLPKNIRAIYYKEGHYLEVYESLDSSGNKRQDSEVWWLFHVSNSFPNQTVIEQINRILTGEVTVENSGNTDHQQYSWKELCEIVSTGALSENGDDIQPRYDYVFIKK